MNSGTYGMTGSCSTPSRLAPVSVWNASATTP